MKPIRKISQALAALLAVLAIGAGALYGQATIDEPVDYSPGNLSGTPATGTGLTGNWTAGGSVTINARSIAYGNLAMSANEIHLQAGQNAAVSMGTSLLDAGLLDDGATLWFSYVLVTDPTASTNDNLSFALGTGILATNNNPGISGGGGVGVSYDRGTYLKATVWNTGRTQGNQKTISKGTPYLIVGKVMWGADDSSNDVVEIYLPGTDLVLPGTPDSTISTIFSQSVQSTFDTLTFTHKDGGEVDIYDEFRVGATYADVVPPDVTDPVLVSTIPANGDGNASVNVIQATFDEPVSVGASGAVRIYQQAGPTLVHTITLPADAAQLSASGFDLTIEPTYAFTPGAQYYIEIDDGVVTDAAGNTYNGFTGSGTWSFTVETTPPTASTWENNVNDGPIYEDQAEVTYTVTFDEPIDGATVGSGDFDCVTTGTVVCGIGTVTQVAPEVFTVIVQPTGTGSMQLRITGEIKDASGNSLVVPVSDPTVITINAGANPGTGDRFWDGPTTTGVTDGVSQGGTATWDTTTTNWDRGAGFANPVAWGNTSDYNAIFGGTAGTVTLDASMNIGSLTFDVPDAGGSGYFIGDVSEDNTLTFVGGGKTITLQATGANSNQDMTIRAGIDGSPTLNITGRNNNSQFFALEPTASVSMTLGQLNMFNTLGSNKQLRLGGASSGNVVDQVTWTVTGNQLQVRKQDSTNGGADGSSWTINQDISLNAGRIYVDEGTLTFSGTDNFCSHSMEIGDGGRIVLQGNWRINDEREDFRVLSGGIVAPGASVGTATFNWNDAGSSTGQVDLRDGSTYEWEVGAGGTDVIAITKPTSGSSELVVGSGGTDVTIKVIDAGGSPSAGDKLTVFTCESGIPYPDVTTLTNNTTIDLTGTSWTGTPTWGIDVDGGTGDATIYITGISSGANDYASWIAGYPGVGGQTGFNDDPDGDTHSNGLENFFGTDPTASSAGLSAGTKSGSTFTFTHPQNASPASDVTAAYRWSTDLATFHADGASSGGTTVDFSASPDTPAPGTTTVTATITGTVPDELFADVEVTQS